MRVVDALKDIRRTQELLDPTSSRFVTGSPAEQERARREWRRHLHIREVVRSNRAEIPRSELAARRFGILEHEPTGDYYRAVGGDPQFLPSAEWFYVTARATWCCSSGPRAGRGVGRSSSSKRPSVPCGGTRRGRNPRGRHGRSERLTSANTLALPTRAWAVMTLATSEANRFRYRRETGGWLLARAEAPTEIVAATGPGQKGELYPDGVWIDHAEFDSAVRRQGFVMCGEWHLHPDGRPTGASAEDQDAWQAERLKAAAETWPAVILARGADGTWKSGSATGFVTTRDGCERVDLTPRFGRRLLEAARHQTSFVAKGPLLRWPSTWEPGELHSAIAMLEVDDEAYEAVQLRQLNERLQRLGLAGNLRPLSSRISRYTGPSGRAAEAGKVHHGGQLIRRPGIGQVLGVR